MKKPRYTAQQIAQALRQAEQGTPVAELCRKLGVSETTFYHWKKRYAGMGVAELRRVKQLEEENRRLKQVVAALTLDKAMLQEVLQKRPEARRAARNGTRADRSIPGAHAAGLWGRPCNRATFYYRSQRRDVTPLRMRLRELAAARPRFGYRRLHILLHREGWRINHKRTYRLYRDEQLGVRVHRRRKRASQLRVRPAAPTRPNERWCMDFMAECLAVEVDTSLISTRVVAVLDRLVQTRGAPATISVDNGSEFYSRTTDTWVYQAGVRLDFSRPGKPMNNPFIESFNGRLRDEHLNTELFFAVADAKAKLLEWQRDYNEVRPHSSLGQIPPREFVAAWQLTRTARGEIRNLETV